MSSKAKSKVLKWLEEMGEDRPATQNIKIQQNAAPGWVVADVSGETVTLMAANDCERVLEAKVANKSLLSKLRELWEAISSTGLGAASAESEGQDEELVAEVDEQGFLCKLSYQKCEYT